MEASVAGQGDAGQDAGQQGPDVGSLLQSLEALKGGQEELRQLLQAAPEEEGEPDLDLSFLDNADPTFDPNTAAERLAQVVGDTADRRAQQIAEQQIAPLREQVQQFQRQQQIDSLVSEFSELGEMETATKTLEASRTIAEQIGHPELAKEPAFWRLVYMAGRAADAHNKEGAAPSAAHLEGGSGATPGGGQVDLGKLIVSAGGGKGRSALPF